MNAIATKARAPKSAKKKPAALPKLITDHGLEERFKRGEVRVDHGAADPENPNRTVSRPKVYTVIDEMEARGTITEEMWLAADRYAEQAEVALGRSLGGLGGEWSGGGLPPWDRSNASEAQLRAMDVLRSGDQAIGPAGVYVVQLLVLLNLPVEKMAFRLGGIDRKTGKWKDEDRMVVKGMVRAHLLRLAEVWGFVAPPAASKIRALHPG